MKFHPPDKMLLPQSIHSKEADKQKHVNISAKTSEQLHKKPLEDHYKTIRTPLENQNHFTTTKKHTHTHLDSKPPIWQPTQPVFLF